MKVSIFAYTKNGCNLAARIGKFFEKENSSVNLFTTERLAEGESGDSFSVIESPKENFYGREFRERDLLIFIGATGIAVREIAPHVKDKTKDPAVISMDERGENIIPILSGHIGGANDFALRIAGEIGGRAVITTATDINNRFSVDRWAASCGLIIEDMEMAKAVSSAILERDLPLISDLPVNGQAAGLYVAAISDSGEICDTCDVCDTRDACDTRDTCDVCEETSELSEDIGIYIGFRKACPFKKTLRLIPRILHVGIGCRRGTPREKIEALFNKVLKEENISERAIKSFSSIDIKSDEAGLIEFAEGRNTDLHFYSAAELNKVEGEFSSSDFVAEITGVDNVCERAAIKSAMEKSEGSPTLILKKTSVDGVTIAIASEYMEVNLG